MTKSPEHGRNEITEWLKRQKLPPGQTVCDVLREMRRQATAAGDKKRLVKIRKAEKFFGCRNQRKRRK